MKFVDIYQYLTELTLFGMSQRVDQILLLKITGKSYEHQLFALVSKVLELRWHSKIKVLLNGTSLLRNIIHTLGLECVQQKILIMKSLQVVNLLDGYWVPMVQFIILAYRY